MANAFAGPDRDDGGAGEDDLQPGATGTDALDAGGAIIDVPGSVDIADGDKGFLAAKKQLLRFSAYADSKYPAMGLKARTFKGGAKCARVHRLLDAMAGHCEARRHWPHDERAICIPLVVAAACAPRERPMTTRRSIHIRTRTSPRSCAC